MFYVKLCNYATGILKNNIEAEEVVQQVFVTIWEKRMQIEIALSFKAYLYKAVYNSCLNRLKQLKKMETTIELPELSAESNKLDAKELERQISLSIEKLPEQCRLIFKLSRFEDLKYAEIANHLNLSIKTVENQMGKALRVLRNELQEYLPTLLFILIQHIL